MSYTFNAFNATSHSTVLLDDWNYLLAQALDKGIKYILRTNSGYYECLNGTTGKLVYGGADSLGSTDGTDATAVFQAAVGNLTASRTYTETIKVVGEWTLDDYITLESYTHLDLTDAYIIIDTTFAKAGAVPGLIINEHYATGGPDHHIFITGGIIFGDKTNSDADNATTYATGIFFRYVRDVIVKDTTITDCKTFGIFFSRQGAAFVGNSYNFWMVNLHVKDCGWDNIAITSEYGHVINCDSSGSGRAGLTCEESRYINITGGSYTGNTENGVECGIANDSRQIRFRIRGVDCYDNTQAGICYAYADDSLISGCTSSDNGSDGIYLINDDNITVSGCHISDNAAYGINVSTGCTGILLSSDNHVHDNTTLDIRLNVGPDTALTPNGALKLERLTDPIVTFNNQADAGGTFTDYDLDDGACTVPHNAVGVVLICRAKDTGASGYQCNVLLRKNGETDQQQECWCACGYIDDTYKDTLCLLEFDDSHKIEHCVGTSGVNSLSFQLILVGWLY